MRRALGIVAAIALGCGAIDVPTLPDAGQEDPGALPESPDTHTGSDAIAGDEAGGGDADAAPADVTDAANEVDEAGKPDAPQWHQQPGVRGNRGGRSVHGACVRPGEVRRGAADRGDAVRGAGGGSGGVSRRRVRWQGRLRRAGRR